MCVRTSWREGVVRIPVGARRAAVPARLVEGDCASGMAGPGRTLSDELSKRMAGPDWAEIHIFEGLPRLYTKNRCLESSTRWHGSIRCFRALRTLKGR